MLLWKSKGGYGAFSYFSDEYNFLGLLSFYDLDRKSFSFESHIIYFFRSLFYSIADAFISCATENREVLSANSLAFDGKPSDESLIQIKKMVDLG